MSKLTRRQLCSQSLPVLAAPFILPTAARAAELHLRFGSNLKSDYPLNVAMTKAAKRIHDATDGKITISIFPNAQLGSETDMLSMVRSGALDFFAAASLPLSTLAPLSAITDVGFAFHDRTTVWQAVDGGLGHVIRSAINKHGVYTFPKAFALGFREITTSTHPVHKPTDLKGLKIRIPPSQIGVSMFHALGASPTTMNFDEVYTALQTGAVDGEENPLSVIYDAKLYEVQKYVSMTNHMWSCWWLLANDRFWSRLSPSTQRLLHKEFTRAALGDRQATEALDHSIRQRLTSKGLKFNTPNPKPFVAELHRHGFYATWEHRFGSHPWHVLKSYSRLLSAE